MIVQLLRFLFCLADTEEGAPKHRGIITIIGKYASLLIGSQASQL